MEEPRESLPTPPTSRSSSNFLRALSGSVLSHSNLAKKPLNADLKPPLPHRIRLYLFKATYPPGGRTLGEHKIQLMVPGQLREQRASFDYSDGRIILLGGYRPDLKIFVLWDADLYGDFPFSRNVQVKAETIYAALGWKMFPAIGRVYVNAKARNELGWLPKYDFGYLLDRLKAGASFKSEMAESVGSKGYHRQL